VTADALKSLLQSIAPLNFAPDDPLYIVFASELPEEFRPRSENFGLTSKWLDLNLQSHLDWRGRGPAIVLNDLAMRAEAHEAAADDPKLVEQLIRQRLVAVALHEAAHVIDRPADYAQPVSKPVVRFARESVLAFCRGAPSIGLPYPWYGHEHAFIRTLLHLVHRAEQHVGQRVPLSLCFSSDTYELSSPWAYHHALGNEPQRFHQLSLSLVKDLPAPPPFVELFNSDVARYQPTNRGD
jgi:hypothetical protein